MPPKVKGTTIIQGNLQFRVDNADAKWATEYEWQLDPKGYVVRYDQQPNGSMYRVPLHREIWKRHEEIRPRVPVSHRNGDLLDNRLSNLCQGDHIPTIDVEMI